MVDSVLVSAKHTHIIIIIIIFYNTDIIINNQLIMPKLAPKHHINVLTQHAT